MARLFSISILWAVLLAGSAAANTYTATASFTCNDEGRLHQEMSASITQTSEVSCQDAADKVMAEFKSVGDPCKAQGGVDVSYAGEYGFVQEGECAGVTAPMQE